MLTGPGAIQLREMLFFFCSKEMFSINLTRAIFEAEYAVKYGNRDAAPPPAN